MDKANKIYFCIFKSSLGVCGISWNEKGIQGLQLPESTKLKMWRRLKEKKRALYEVSPPKWIMRIITRVQKHLDGSLQDFSDVPIDLPKMSTFSNHVYSSVRTVLAGQTKTYGELAKQVRSPNAARAVGQALRRNSIGLIIPCHRIIASGQKIGGFSAFGGPLMKEKLLSIEGIFMHNQRNHGCTLSHPHNKKKHYVI